MKTLQITLLSLIAIIGFSQEIKFEQVPNYTPNSQFIANFDHGGNVEFADIDGDGDIDALYAIRNGIIIYENIENKQLQINGDSTFIYYKKSEADSSTVITRTLTVFDIDNDGDQDFLVAFYNNYEKSGNVKIFYNDGLGNFTHTQTPSDLYLSSHDEIYNADIDNDGDQDFAITGFKIVDSATYEIEDIYEIYVNDGDGKFTKTDDNIPTVSYGELDFFDVDNDNDLDAVVVGNRYVNGNIKSAKLYINNNNTFSEKNAPFIGCIFCSTDNADIDQDGDKDIIISGDNLTQMYLNDGAGNFILDQKSNIDNLSYSGVSFLHLNSDNKIDLLVTGKNSNGSDNVTKAYINDGTGFFSSKQNTEFVKTSQAKIETTDLNGDGHTDIFIFPNTYINDGLGNFELLKSNPLNFSTSPLSYFSTKITDINNDNFDDIIISEGNEVSIYENNNGQNFTNSSTLDIGFRAYSIIPININNDTKKDLLIRFKNNDNKHELKLFMQTQNGFSAGSPFLINDLSVEQLVIIDIDNDNDDDLLIKYEREPLKIIKNNNGIFEYLPQQPFDNIEIEKIQVSDLDNDNDQDIVVLEKNGNDELITNLYTNDEGNFTFNKLILENVLYKKIEISDINNDSLNDIILIGENKNWSCENNEDPTYIYLNDGQLGFFLFDSTSVKGLKHSYTALTFVDLNNDGKKDLLTPGEHCTTLSPGYISTQSLINYYLNDGNGNFTKIDLFPEYTDLNNIQLRGINYNGDNKQDLLLTGATTTGRAFLRVFSNHSESSTTSLFNNFDYNKKTTNIVYPNPVNDEIFIDLKNKNNVSIIISSSDNKKVFSKDKINSPTLKLNLGHLKSGVYFVEIITEKGREMSKFIKR